MLTEKDEKFWTPNENIVESLVRMLPEGATVLEIGPGLIPFPRATHFIDSRPDDDLYNYAPRENVLLWDVHNTPLPYPDKFFDFIYCRHVIEDLHYPHKLIEEMSRIGKRGFIETPSPMAELSRGIDGSSPKYRGYHHHNWFVWNLDEKLFLFKKLPKVEYADFPDEALMYSILRTNPIAWNSYLLWDHAIEYHEIEYTYYNNDVLFVTVLRLAVENSYRYTAKSLERLCVS
ncbi:MAG: methyltransferase domain-containing protein [Rhodospirillaceae bacterium]